MKKLNELGAWAVVTGASSGIGEAFAEQLAAQGLNLVVAARRRERLEELRERVGRASGVEVRPLVADLGKRAGVAALLAETEALDVGMVVANAGFGLKGAFVELELERQLEMLELNCKSQLELCHGFSRRLAARGRGALIITSSTAAFQGTPYTAAYGASKAFLLSFAEALAEELAPSNVWVQALCPGPTDTEGPRRTGVDPSRVPNMMTSREVVSASLERLGSSVVVVPGATNRVASALTRFVPRRVASRIAGRMIRRATGD